MIIIFYILKAFKFNNIAQQGLNMSRDQTENGWEADTHVQR